MKDSAREVIDATFRDNAGHYEFRVVYKSKRSFLAAISRSTRSTFVSAVDRINNKAITPATLSAYKAETLKNK